MEDADWRLPTGLELHSLTDITERDPAYDTSVFNASPANYFWSGTIDVSSSRPWFLATREGARSYADMITEAAVRCVR